MDGCNSIKCVLTLVAVLFTARPILSGCPAEAAPQTPQQKQVDQAVVRALKFLAEQQQADGSWQVDQYGESTAATSLAIMAFLAAGHVPGEGPYGDQLTRGIRWVIEHQQPDGMIVHKRSHGPMYSHGISTLMLAEVTGMLDEPLADDCRKVLQRGVRLILEAQNIPKSEPHAGGWRYQPDSRDSDLSVTGWQLLALRAAKNVGCDVPAEHIDRAVEYVKRCTPGNHVGFSYQPGGSTSPTRSGTGILALEVCGAHQTPEALRAADYLLERPLQAGDQYFYYGVYYCTVGLFKVGGKYWDESKAHLATTLLTEQAADGSWLAHSGSERSAGKVYCTSMAVLALAVEYRYLPIYQR